MKTTKKVETKAAPKVEIKATPKVEAKAPIPQKVEVKEAKPVVKRQGPIPCEGSGLGLGDLVEFVGRVTNKKGKQATIVGRKSDPYGFKLKYTDGSLGTATVRALKLVKKGDPTKVEVKLDAKVEAKPAAPATKIESKPMEVKKPGVPSKGELVHRKAA